MNNLQIYRAYLLATFASLCICLFSVGTYAQATHVDSLKQAALSAKTDTDKVKSLLAVSDAVSCSDTLHKLKYANDALQLAENTKWQKGMMMANQELGVINVVCGKNYEGSIRYYQAALTIAKTIDDKPALAELLCRIAFGYKNIEQYSKALDYYRAALSLKTDLNMELGVLSNMGIVYTNVGDYPHAIGCYENSLKILNEIIKSEKNSDIYDTLQMTGLLFTIGDIYFAMRESDKALKNYDTALKLTEQTKDKSFALYALTGIAKVYRYQEDFVKAAQFYDNALLVCIDAHNVAEETNVLDQLAETFLEKGDIPTAVDYAQRSLKLADSSGVTQYLPKNYITLGMIYTRQGKYAEAVDYLKKAIALCEKDGSLDLEKDALEALSKVYDLMKEPGLALTAYRQFVTIKDSLYNLARANEITRIDLQSAYSQDSLKQAGEYGLKMQKQQVYTLTGYAGLAMVLLLTFFVYRSYMHQKKANIAISNASEEVIREKQVSEQLLLNILPEEVAKELISKGDVEAKLFDNVTVLFTDFINFTAAAENFTPKELVAELHTCFTAFDKIISKYNIEKIKTVGDAYMIASGLPQPNADHCADVIKAAIEIRNFMVARRQQMGDRTFGIRIGINSGTVVAGIVGATKFAYDIWGDTVNIAARMEQYGESGKINISHESYEIVQGRFTFTDRGEIDAKHKGKMRMYFVEA